MTLLWREFVYSKKGLFTPVLFGDEGEVLHLQQKVKTQDGSRNCAGSRSSGRRRASKALLPVFTHVSIDGQTFPPYRQYCLGAGQLSGHLGQRVAGRVRRRGGSGKLERESCTYYAFTELSFCIFLNFRFCIFSQTKTATVDFLS